MFGQELAGDATNGPLYEPAVTPTMPRDPADETQSDREQRLRRLFRASLWLKAANSVVELVAGAAVSFASSGILGATKILTSHELLEDPNDVVANALLSWANALSMSPRTSVSLYLLSHGAVKLFLVIMLLMGKHWAYPVFMALLTVLITYQTYQLSLHFTIWLTLLTVFDLLVLYLTTHEYRLHRRAGWRLH